MNKMYSNLLDLLKYANSIEAVVVTSRPVECIQIATDNDLLNIKAYLTHEHYYKKMKFLDKSNKYCIDNANIIVEYLDNIYGYTVEI